MNRRWLAAAAAGLAFAPVAVRADSAPPPSPSPSLQSILLAPPAAYATPPTGSHQGPFTIAEYSTTWGSDATKALNQLQIDGFVAGYQIARADTSTGRVMVELVVAFTGQRGAVRFLNANLAEIKGEPSFKHSDPIAGVGPNSYGAHLVQASPTSAADAFSFVKGNDLFAVTIAAAKDDAALFEYAQVQAEKQYAAAPWYTIPLADWPENQGAQPTDQGFSLGDGPEIFAGVAVIALLVGAGVFVWMRQNELKPEKPKIEGKLTADGQFWWNGTYWIASSEVAPPWARRSRDGAYWWDGQEWRVVPRPTIPAGR